MENIWKDVKTLVKMSSSLGNLSVFNRTRAKKMSHSIGEQGIYFQTVPFEKQS
jgi:hypothetical protein